MSRKGRLRFAMIGAGAIAQTYAQAFQNCRDRAAGGRGGRAPRGGRRHCPDVALPQLRVLRRDARRGRPATRSSSALRRRAMRKSASTVLDRGVHVLCEKPLAIDSRSAAACSTPAERDQRLLTMASKFRFVEDVVRAKALVTSGIVGDMVLFENTFTSRVDMSSRWNSNPAQSGGGVLIDNGTHSVDLMRYFLGPLADLQAVEGKRIQGLAVEDTVRIFVRTEGGVMGSIDLSWTINKEQPNYLSIYGSAGTILVGWKESKYRRTKDADWTVFGRGYDKLQAFRRQIDNFSRAIRGEEPLVVTPQDALASVEAIEAGYEALRRSRWQPVQPSRGNGRRMAAGAEPRKRRPPVSPRVHPTAIVEEGVVLGRGTAVWDNVHIRRDTRLGEECIVGEKTYIAYGVRIGNRVKINAFVYICTGVTIEDGVMVSAGTVFTNDRFPARPRRRPEAAAPLRSRRAHAAHAGPRRGHDRRPVHHRQRPGDRPLRHGRDGERGDQVRARFSPRRWAIPARSAGCVCRCGQLLLRFPGDGPADLQEAVCVRRAGGGTRSATAT